MNRSLAHQLALLGIAITLLFAGCAAPKPTPGPSAAVTPNQSQPPTVPVVQPTRGPLSSTLTYSGNVQAKQQVMIIPKVAGRITRLAVDVGSAVKAGDVLVEIEREVPGAQLVQAEAGLAAAEARVAGLRAAARPETIAQAEAGLEVARLRLADLEAGGRSEQIAQAQANLDAAEARLAQVKAGPTPEQIAVAEAQVRTAKNQLYLVQSQADAYLGNPATWRGLIIFTEDMKEAQSGVAYEQVQLAEANLAVVKAGATPEQIDQAQAGVDAAREQLELARNPYTGAMKDQARQAIKQAQAQLDLARAPVQEHDLNAAQAGVDQARAAVDLARLQLNETSIRAPFEGVISQRMAAEGGMAGPTSPLLSLVSSATEVLVSVEESRLGDLRPGQVAVLAASAYPGQEIKARITSIAPTVDPRSRMAQVRLAPDDQYGKLRDGMSAQVQIPAEDSNANALLVPITAITRQDGGASVYLLADGRIRRQTVTLGASDGQRTEVLSGLTENDRVVTSGQANLKEGDPAIAR